jgi:predicted dipeptidase
VSCSEKAAVPQPVRTAEKASPARAAVERYDEELKERLVPLLVEAVSFATYEGTDEAHAAQKEWLASTAAELGFDFRDAGAMFEVTLPGPEGSPVLGLLVHGDVVKAEEAKWSFPPFEATVADGTIHGRGVADDKGPLVQALLAMKALADAGPERRATIRLIVGTNEESTAEDIEDYLGGNPAPDFSLVLDSNFPLNIGEKAWNALYVFAPIGTPQRGDQPWIVEDLRAGLATSIVPDEATIVLLWIRGEPDWAQLVRRLEGKVLPEGTSLELAAEGSRLTVRTRGLSAHAGDNLRNGRNALVALAGLLEGELPEGSPAQLLAFARMAGSDLTGGGLGIDQTDPIWGTYDVNVATILPDEDDPSRYRLAINVRRIPPWTQEDLKVHLTSVVDTFNREHSTSLTFDGWWDSEPLVIDPESPAVRRLLAIYERATGEASGPSVSSGGTYAKRTPRSIAFGMWFPGTPYPGHGVDEKVPVESLHRGAHVLIEALVDLACSDEPLPTIVRQGASIEE